MKKCLFTLLFVSSVIHGASRPAVRAAVSNKKPTTANLKVRPAVRAKVTEITGMPEENVEKAAQAVTIISTCTHPEMKDTEVKGYLKKNLPQLSNKDLENINQSVMKTRKTSTQQASIEDFIQAVVEAFKAL
jgi:hypothetical protein